VTPAEAAADSGKQMKKSKKKTSSRSSTTCDPWAPERSGCSASEDFDRRNAGGGGGY
jgi:hypothetical protein